MTEPESLVLEERRGNVVLLTLNRPERHHALSAALNAALDDAFSRAADDADVACVILTGAGDKAFCAGGDMLEMSGVETQERPRRTSSAIARPGAC